MNTRPFFFISIFIMLSTYRSEAQIIPQITNASNVNATDGSIVLSVQGGFAPYSYHWNRSPENSNEIFNLAAGQYCVTVTDILGCCSMEECFTVGSDCPFLVDGISYTNVCVGNGTLSAILANDGTPPYLFQWSNGATTQSLSGLSAGRYCVTVTDQTGCSNSGCIDLQDKIRLSATVTQLCDFPQGGINLHVSGGVSPYSYQWSNGHTVQDLANLPKGTYCVTVTDLNGCKSTKCFEIDRIVKLSATVLNRCGIDNGEIDLTVSGAENPTYLWSGSQGTAQDIKNVAAGNYCVTVTSQTGCTNRACYEVLPNMVINFAPTPTCPNQQNGPIDATQLGGRPPMNYIWSNRATIEDISNLSQNLYFVTATDSRGCSAIGNTYVVEKSVAFNSIVKNYCGPTSFGHIVLSAYPQNSSFLWSTGATTYGIALLNSGNYCVTVTEPSGCTASKCFTIRSGLSPQGIYVNSISQVSSCLTSGNGQNWNACNGALNIGVDLAELGGNSSGSISYQWSGPLGFLASGPSIANLCVGLYTVTVSDQGGYSTTRSFNICCCDDQSEVPNHFYSTCTHGGASAQISISASNTAIIPAKYENGFLGSITLALNGVLNPERYYNWSGPNNFVAHTKDITRLNSGIYCVTVSNGCSTTSTCFNLNECSLSTSPQMSTNTSPSCQGGNSGTIRVTPSNPPNGQPLSPPYKVAWPGGSSSNFTGSFTIQGLAPGSYTITLTDSKSCSVTRTISIQTDPSGGFVFPLSAVNGFYAVDPCFDAWENARIEIYDDDCYNPNNRGIPNEGFNYYLTVEWPDQSTTTLTVKENGIGYVPGSDNYDFDMEGVYYCALIDQYGCRKEWCFEFGEETQMAYPIIDNDVSPPGDPVNTFAAITGCKQCKNCGAGNCPTNQSTNYNPYNPAPDCYNYEEFQEFSYTPAQINNPCSGGGIIHIACDNTDITIVGSSAVEFIDWESGEGVAEGVCEYDAGCLFLGESTPFFQGGDVYVKTKIRLANPDCHAPIQTLGNPYVFCIGGVIYETSQDKDCWGVVKCKFGGAIVHEGLLEEFTRICYKKQSEAPEAQCDKVLVCTLTRPNIVLEVLDSDVPCPEACSQICDCVPVARPGIKTTKTSKDRNGNEEPNFNIIQEFHVYPNPFDQFLVVEYESKEDRQIALLIITDIVGKSILKTTQPIHEGTNRFTISTGNDFVPGLYFVTLRDKNGYLNTVKAVKIE